MHLRTVQQPTGDCALYTVTGTDMARGTPSKRTAAPGTAVASGAVAGKTTVSGLGRDTYLRILALP